ncbi:mitochondrial ubiquitin ligase activator of NFKB 1-like [Dendronephthya gigantea]|uniref:mitochondrial ubiquitin ligase activator of NFKB 1-like n=1 Tax=Dendronephthya gigantea TaxID=151771 RepID=UPI00106D90A2|nr:mitochondrial ubiquitin ligase activator of NFKB 1-like [Dendronephthya gigantea]XP_028415228.1 mitochondrial ubiquitin ligase activator of NFKB 1-like [Dendronephthya gigantea]
MDGFMFFGGVGSLAIAGLCYSAYRNIQDAASHLKNTESLDVGKALLKKIEKAPNHTLDYVAIRGNAKALESTLPTSNVPSAKVLIQKLTLYEHKVEWVKSSKLWHDTTRTISSVVNHVPFSLNASRHSVTIDEPLSASGLELNRIYSKYEPVDPRSISTSLVQWVSGEKTKGIQTIEDGLLEGTSLTAVGKITLRNGILKMRPPENEEYILSKLPLDGIIREKTKSLRIWKYVTMSFAFAGGVLLLIWFYRWWRKRRRRWQAAPQAAPRRDDMDRVIHLVLSGGETSEAGEGQSCVICLTRPRNVVILDCGHICACRECLRQVNNCPICRAEIVRLVPTYQS